MQSSKTLSEVAFRPAAPGDLGFILKSWIRQYANSPWAGAMTRQRQVEAIRGTIADLLKRDAVHVEVACLQERPSQLLGFVCYETGWPWPVVHYVYVKDWYRDAPVDEALVARVAGNSDQPVRYTHRTHQNSRVFRDAKYVPSLARYPKREKRES